MMRLVIDERPIYEGAPISVPRAGDVVRTADGDVRVEACSWNFDTADTIVVTLVVGTQPYTF